MSGMRNEPIGLTGVDDTWRLEGEIRNKRRSSKMLWTHRLAAMTILRASRDNALGKSAFTTQSFGRRRGRTRKMGWVRATVEASGSLPDSGIWNVLWR